MLTEFGMDVLNLILDNSWITKARLIDHLHTLLHYIRMRWVSLLKDSLLLQAEESIVSIEVWNNEVKDVCARALLQTSCQFEKTSAKHCRNPLLPQQVELYQSLQLALVFINLFVICPLKQYFHSKPIELDLNDVLRLLI